MFVPGVHFPEPRTLRGNKCNRLRFTIRALGFFFLLFPNLARTSPAATPGLPFTEDFTSIALRDATRTKAGWSTAPPQLTLGPTNPLHGTFSASSIGSDVGTEDPGANVAAGDMDGDGDLDIVAARGVGNRTLLYLNNGTSDPWNGVEGTYVSTDTWGVVSLDLGDIDRDGDLDVVVALPNPRRLSVYLNNGTATPFHTAGVPVTRIELVNDSLTFNVIALGDVDGDGDLDLVVGGGWVGTRNRLYINNGNIGGWEIKEISNDIGSVTNVSLTKSLALGDVDGDGDLDLVTGNRNLPNRLYLNDGVGDPWDTVTTGIPITSDVQTTYSVALGDLDGDGDIDLVTGNENQTNRMYLNDGVESPWDTLSTGTSISPVGYFVGIRLADLDADGDLDVVAGGFDAVENHPLRVFKKQRHFCSAFRQRRRTHQRRCECRRCAVDQRLRPRWRPRHRRPQGRKNPVLQK